MPNVVLDADRLAKLDNAAACLGSTREDALNQAIDKFSAYLSDKTDYDQWLARKVAKSIKAADDGKLLSSSDVDAQSEALIAHFAPALTK